MISINGMSFEVRQGQIYVNGVLMVPANPQQAAALKGQKSEYDLTLDRDGQIKGDVKGSLSVSNHSPSPVTLVIHGSVTGSVNATQVTCGDVGGSVNSSAVTCGSVRGSVNAASVTRMK